MNISCVSKKLTKSGILSALSLFAIYSLSYIFLAQKGRVGTLIMENQKVKFEVEVWAPYGFVQNGRLNNFLYFVYRPFYSLEMFLGEPNLTPEIESED